MPLWQAVLCDAANLACPSRTSRISHGRRFLCRRAKGFCRCEKRPRQARCAALSCQAFASLQLSLPTRKPTRKPTGRLAEFRLDQGRRGEVRSVRDHDQESKFPPASLTEKPNIAGDYIMTLATTDRRERTLRTVHRLKRTGVCSLSFPLPSSTSPRPKSQDPGPHKTDRLHRQPRSLISSHLISHLACPTG